jgi:hypothetical protein
MERQLLAAFYARLEAELTSAYGAGVDLAVSDFTWTHGNMVVTFLRYIDGMELPAGRRWTIYRTSDPAIRDQVDALLAAKK